MNRYTPLLMASMLVGAGAAQAGTCPSTNVIEDPVPFYWTDSGGYWSGTLEIGEAIFTDIGGFGGDTLTTRAYRQAPLEIPSEQPGGNFNIPGPTMTMTPGQTYVLTFKNTLPYETPSPEHNVFKDPNITNIHTHGLHVSGETPADDVTRLINGGECGDYVYAIPGDHMGGTLWYHAHHHGSTWLQVAGGAFGLLIIDDSNDGLPTGVANMTERQLAIGFLDPSVAGNGGDTLVSGTLSPTWTVNGLVGGSLCTPAGDTPEGEWQHWRVLLADADARMKTLEVGPECEAVLMARDGVWRTEAPLALPAGSIELTGASRADLAVRCSADSTISVNGKVVANVVVDDNLPDNPTSGVGPYSNGATGGIWSAKRPPYLSDLSGVTQVNRQTINMGARTINGDKFDAEVPTFSISETELDVQELRIKGATNHPYHQHVYHMQTNGACGDFEDGEWYDTIATNCLVRFDLNPDISSVYDGRTIMHCHILGHEDQGAMGWFDVVGGQGPPAFPDTENQAVLYDQVDGECIVSASCVATEPGTELTCDDGIDNDCDGDIDAADSDCAAPPVDCSQYGDRNSCRSDSSCRWNNKNDQCIAK
jgi:FtsP/CotA-like multicopper oxidase with cupredoxin domain